MPDPPPPPWRPVLLSPTSRPTLRATWLLVSLPESASLRAVSWLTGGQHQTRQPGGPWLCALLPDVPDMPVGRPRADGPVGRQLGSADTLRHHPGGHRAPLASSITATPKLAVVLRGGGWHPSNTTQASSTGSRPNPSPSLSSAAHPRPSLFPSLDLSLFRSTKGSFLDTLQQEGETVKSLSR